MTPSSPKRQLALFLALAIAHSIPAHAEDGARRRVPTATRHQKGVFRGLGRIASRTKGAVQAWIGKAKRSINTDKVLDRANPFEVYQSRLLGVSHERLTPKGFFNGPGPIVGVNGVKRLDMYRDAADFMSGCEHSNVRQSRVYSPESLVDRLLTVYRRDGPIKKLVIAAHGHRGSMDINGTALDKKWARKNADWLASLPKDLFAPGAQVALVSCSTAAGFVGNSRYGVNALREIFSPLMKQGGTVVASRRYVNPELGKIPKKYTNVFERLSRHLLCAPVGALAGTVNWCISDWKTKREKIAEIKIEAWRDSH